MKRVVFCLAVLWCMIGGILAQGDTTGCNAQAYFSYSGDPATGLVFTAQYSGVNNPQILWYVDGNMAGTGNPFTDNVAAGSEVCVIVTGFASYYDSLQQTWYTDSCMASYCDYVFADSSGTGGCNAQAYFTYSTDPAGSGMTFVAQYSGVNNPVIQWYVNGTETANGSTYSANLPSGTEVCVVVTGYNFVYDSLQQTTDVDTCVASYCEYVFADSSGTGGGCNASVYYTYQTDAQGTNFSAQYSGLSNPVIYWYVDGTLAGNGQTYSANLPEGTMVCVVASEYNSYYDSLQQTWYTDSCEASYCDLIYSDSSGGNGCNIVVSYDYSTDPATGTTFTAQYSNANNPYVNWYVDGSLVGSGDTYTGNVSLGEEVCVTVTSYEIYYDSLQQMTDVDTCTGIFCSYFQIAAVELSQLVEITAYPNPATDIVSLKIGNEVLVGRVVIVDLYGRETLVSDQTTQIDISGLKKGIYYIQVLDNGGNAIWNQQLVKN